MVKAIFASAVILVWLLFLSGCATLYNSATGKNELIFINSATETAMGRSVQNDLLKKHPLANDAALQARVQRVGGLVAEASDRKDIVYRFSVLEDKELNAMALPGGYIYIYKGLMDIINDDELAYVLGHETGHVAARHIAKKLQSNMAYQLILNMAFVGVSATTGVNAQPIALGADKVYSLIELGFSRKDEYEADRLAAKYAFRSGFNPYGAISALKKIKKQEGPNWKALGYFRSHPYAEDRIKALTGFIPGLTTQKK
ncbi:MAG: M48 family metalloprotease [Candidatus Omnitrophota bacterium]|nr:M48 family metalloprotease [Candidatus Omnitrophota bacterium]MBU1929833.1 M48 family metalloprotease [Candidatus Omnitrophota bacterium]MBU2035319.1 M48 family metalloprotease [Candidatus Omnitrophota bacterium]MBU2257500.1 M48 family metalloprotease [Candidatus Omnitrophota bacterium]